MSDVAEPLKAEQSGRPLILIVEDDDDMAREIASELLDHGYAVTIVDNEPDALLLAKSNDVAVIIADRMLHGTDSIDMVKSLRSEGLRIPVLFLSAMSLVDDRIKGLKAGGDDYIGKPFSMAELTARVEALLRRSDLRPPGTILTVGPLELDLLSRKARRGNRSIDLLPREFQLLEYMMRHKGQVVTRSMLLEEIWNYRFLQTNLADVHLGKVRRKVDASGEEKLFRSVRGVGYILDAAD